MKFSEFEQKMDEFWNQSVVNHYSQIKTIINTSVGIYITQDTLKAVNDLICHYCMDIIKLTKQIDMQMAMVDDHPEQVQVYIKDVRDEVQADFEEFAKYVTSFEHRLLMSKILSHLNTFIEDSAFSLQNSRETRQLHNEHTTFTPLTYSMSDIRGAFFEQVSQLKGELSMSSDTPTFTI